MVYPFGYDSKNNGKGCSCKKKEFTLGKLSIETEKLIIKTHFLPKKVEVDFCGSKIEAKEIEIIQVHLVLNIKGYYITEISKYNF
ncbi:MAG: hypothetical protein ACW97Z_05260 [Candidatus Hodarchaeales archaeon]|jgi:hypothetical protein